jgi:hypothetical protein
MNTLDQVTVCNQAISAIGITRFIQNMNEGSIEAETCLLFWDSSVDQVLSDFDWNFARRYDPLALSKKTVPIWRYCYAYPASCIKARAIIPTCSNPDLYPLMYKKFLQEHRVPFDISENEAGGGLVVCTNIDTPILAYTARVKMALWSGEFITAFKFYMSSLLAAPLSASPEYAPMVGDEYKNALLDAGAKNLNEAQKSEPPESEFIRARQ